MEPNIKGGCILLARKIIESEIWEKPPLYIKVWVFLLSSAQYKPYKNMIRGQVFTSIPDIIEGCKWRIGARVERPTKDQIYQIIEWLRKPNEGGNESNAKATMITTTKATHGMLINIDNYGFYQDFKNYESNDESNDEKAANPLRKQRQPDNINKESKEEQENKELIIKPFSQIDDFRSRYSIDQLKLIDGYIDMIKQTRRSGKIADSVIGQIYEYFAKFPQICVEYAVKTHLNNPQYHTRKENYTYGILRNTNSDEAFEKLSSTSLSKPSGNYSTKAEKNKSTLQKHMEAVRNEQRGNIEITSGDLFGISEF